ncbi:Centrosomal protein of 95 kDa, partial [Ophiophagus hannah]
MPSPGPSFVKEAWHRKENTSCAAQNKSSQSSELLDAWEAGGSESTSELIKLGDTAYLFSLRNEAKSAQLSEEQLSSNAKKLGDPIRPAIALQPPYQPSISGVSYLAERNNITGDRDSPPPLLPLKPQELPPTVLAEPPERESSVFSDGIQSFPDATSCKNRSLKCFVPNFYQNFPTELSGTGVGITGESVPQASSHDSGK